MGEEERRSRKTCLHEKPAMKFAAILVLGLVCVASAEKACGPEGCDSEKGDCHPKCQWKCDSPVCNQVCEPICEQPKCSTRCQELGCSKCAIKYEKPQCEVRCPIKHCEKGACPKCDTVCKEPECALVCEKAPHCQPQPPPTDCCTCAQEN